jgi:hypothetical protein
VSDELMPCPICGGKPDFQRFGVTPNVRGRIICKCGLEIRQGANETEDDLRIIWNTRAGDRTRWHELFGTPERAAETMFTLMLNCARGDGPCERCPAYPRCNWASDDGEENESMMLEWLRGDAK